MKIGSNFSASEVFPHQYYPQKLGIDPLKKDPLTIGTKEVEGLELSTQISDKWTCPFPIVDELNRGRFRTWDAK